MRSGAGAANRVVLWAAVAASAAGAQEPKSTVETVVVTASRVEQRVTDAIPHTTVITEREIRESGARDVMSLLAREPGFQFTQTGGIGSSSAVFMRGGEARQTLILVDGIRVDSATTGATAIDQILLDNIERIEIVRGNVSSLYGSTAVGGVIQIFTRQGRGEPRAEARLTAGSQDTRRLTAGYGGESGPLRFRVDVSSFRTGGFSALDTRVARGANPDRDGYDNLTVSWNIGWRLNERNELGLRMHRSAGEIEFDNAFAASPADRHRSENRVGHVAAWWAGQPVDSLRSRVTLAEGIDDNDNFTNDRPDGRFKTKSRQLQFTNEWMLGADHVLTAGYEHLEQKVESSTLYTDSSRRVNSLFAGLNSRFGAHQLQLNARHDRNSDFGSATTGLAGYAFQFTPALKLTASVSSAFNAPTFNFLYFPGFGNPDLDAERSRSREAGLQYAADGVIARLVWFRTDYRDLIENVAPTFLPQNVSRARVDGVELSVSGKMFGFDWRGGLTVQDPVNEVSNLQLLRRATRHGSLAVARDLGAWRFSVETLASGSRPDRSIATFGRIDLPGYAVVNATARYQLGRQWTISARLENAFDREYRTIDGYNSQPRSLFVSVGWQP